MVLNERKIKILEAIIHDYICTGEPIGSRTIAKKYDLGISSATIRNEMSDLEDMGFIVQPHASAGRAPSDMGYRYYVDQMMRCRDLTNEETLYLRQMIADSIDQVDSFMQAIAKAVAILTNYTTIVSEPQFTRTLVKHVQLVPLDEESVVMMLVTDSKTVRNSIIRLDAAPDYAKLSDLSIMLNNTLGGRSFEEIKARLSDELLALFPKETEVLAPVLEAVLSIIQKEDHVRVYTSGVKNILTFPEFSSMDKALPLFQALEERDILITLLDSGGTDDIQMIIGSENNMAQMRDCSIIKANYTLGGQHGGSIGIIGPTRMDYLQVTSVLNGIVKNIGQVLSGLKGG